MTDREENSFDIQFARELSHKLSIPPGDKNRANFTIKTPDYPKFSSIPVKKESVSYQESIVEHEDDQIIKQPDSGFASLESLVEWCHNASNADISFVVDSQGFIISSYGNLSHEQSEGIGAELSYALEQLNRIADKENKLLSVNLEYKSQHIFGFQVDADEHEQFIFGFITNTPLQYRTKEVIKKITKDVLPSIS